MESYHIKRRKTSPGRKKSGTKLRERMNQLLIWNCGIKYRSLLSKEQNVKFNHDFQEKRESIQKDLYIYQKKIKEYVNGIKALYLDKVKGIISESDYLDLSNDFSTEKERLEKLVIETQKQLAAIDKKLQDSDSKRQLIEQYPHLEHLDREIVEILIDYILVGKKDPVTKEVPIEIHWNF